MTFKNKAIELANEAKNNVQRFSKEVQGSQMFDQTKSTLAETKEKATAIDSSALKLMNFFAVFSLSALLISTFFPLANVMGSSIALSDFSPSWLYVIAALALCSNLFGAKQLVSRGLIIFLLAAISFTVFQQVSDMLQVFGAPRSRDLIRLATEVLGAGFYLFVVSFILIIITALKPGYKTNNELWDKLIQK
jgi:flagellar biosynthesis protein FlhB